MTDWIVAISSALTAGAIILQYLMWQVAKEQNDLQSRPLLRLKRRRSRVVPPEQLSEAHKVMHARDVFPQYQSEIEEEWKTHVQSTPANLAIVPDEEIGFEVENVGGVISTAFTLQTNITVDGNPSDKQVKPKAYTKELSIEVDIPPSKSVFIPLLRCRFLFGVGISGRITSITGPLGKQEALKDNMQPQQDLSFENTPLITALRAKAPTVEDEDDDEHEYNPFADEDDREYNPFDD